MILPWGCFCPAEQSSVLPLPDKALSLPHARCPACRGNANAGVSQHSFGCHFSYWKAKSLGRSLCVLVLCKGLVPAPSQVSAAKVQRTKCYKKLSPAVLLQRDESSSCREGRAGGCPHRGESLRVPGNKPEAAVVGEWLGKGWTLVTGQRGAWQPEFKTR